MVKLSWPLLNPSYPDPLITSCLLLATVTTRGNGNSALQLLRERPTDFDLVLSDVYMPGEALTILAVPSVYN